ncbi:phenylacetate--CoA ligase family protein [Formosa haliotis]|uniref:phenylacetate--CoA ligase family protein n=1 Tax=Formosa haliotis TaxID=1555194 RepID=UPI00082451C5|nr:phenylacetate--CoA ligase family protein [Formosa haliotis]
MLNVMRKTLFWTVDFIKGSRIKTEYSEIRNILENLNSKEVKILQEYNLKKILRHAKETTMYYKNIETCDQLSNYPVIDKNVIKEHYEKFKSSMFLDKSNISAYTSGSTGTPFKIYQNQHKKYRNTADVIYFAELSGFEIGDKLFYIRHWDEYNSKTPFEAWKRNITMHPVSKLSETDVKNLLDEIQKNNSRKGIIIYASALNVIRDYILKFNLKPIRNSGVTSIIAIAEALNERTKLIVQEYFGVKVVSRYSNVENGIIAQQFLGKSNNFYINWASYFVEILKLNSDDPVEKGELGRIVVTDLFNYCMPMIRYDTGDIGMMNYEDNLDNDYPVLMRIEGRKMDMIFDANGNHISSYMVYNILKYPFIKQYQFIQIDDKKYLFKLNVEEEFHSEKDIKNEFLNLLGSNAEIEFTYVNEIPLLSSGKRKYVVNKTQKKS